MKRTPPILGLSDRLLSALDLLIKNTRLRCTTEEEEATLRECGEDYLLMLHALGPQALALGGIQLVFDYCVNDLIQPSAVVLPDEEEHAQRAEKLLRLAERFNRITTVRPGPYMAFAATP